MSQTRIKPVAAAADLTPLSNRLAARGATHVFRTLNIRVTCKTLIAQAMLEDIRAACDRATTFTLQEAYEAAVRGTRASAPNRSA